MGPPRGILLQWMMPLAIRSSPTLRLLTRQTLWTTRRMSKVMKRLKWTTLLVIPLLSTMRSVTRSSAMRRLLLHQRGPRRKRRKLKRKKVKRNRRRKLGLFLGVYSHHQAGQDKYSCFYVHTHIHYEQIPRFHNNNPTSRA